MKARFLAQTETTDGLVPAGHVTTHPDAHLLCQLGIAEPADDECQARYDAWLLWREARQLRRAPQPDLLRLSLNPEPTATPTTNQPNGEGRSVAADNPAPDGPADHEGGSVKSEE